MSALKGEKWKVSIAPQQCVSELLISMLGEPSMLIKMNVDGTKLVVATEFLVFLPSMIETKMERLADLAMNVRCIGAWRHGFITDDPIKRAFVESICESIDVFFNEVDNRRMNHLSYAAECTFDELVLLIEKWNDRIDYVCRLTQAGREMCGMELMNLVFSQWSTRCIADWSYNVLKVTLERMSSAFHVIASEWLLHGKLIKKNWMIREPIDTSMSQQLNSSLNSSNGEKCLKKPFAKLEARLEQDYSPIPLTGSRTLLKKILDIGKNVCFLREFRQQKTYDYRLAERTRLLDGDGVDKARLWFSVAERSRLCSIIYNYARIVSEDVMNEILVKQRLLDHIAFVQTHFLLLRGDFIMNMEDAIREAPKKGRSSRLDFVSTHSAANSTATHNNNNNKGSSPSFVAEACLVFAIDLLYPTQRFNGLKQYLIAERSKVSSCTYKSINGGDSDAVYLEDLFKLVYRPPTAVSPILTGQYIQIYGKLFSMLCFVRFLALRVDDVSAHFTRCCRRTRFTHICDWLAKRRSDQRRHGDAVAAGGGDGAVIVSSERSACVNDENGRNRRPTTVNCGAVILHVYYSLMTIRQFITTFVRFIFELLLPVECAKVQATMASIADLPSLIAAHGAFLSAVTTALFLHKSAVDVYDAFRGCVKAARKNLQHITTFVETLDENGGHFANDTQRDRYDAFLSDNFAYFLENMRNFQETFSRLLCTENAKQSAYWAALNLSDFNKNS